MLAVQVERQLGEFSVDVSFTSDTAATALFGPSGAGKTSVINMIAGLLNPKRGRIVLGDDVLFDSATGINMPGLAAAHRLCLSGRSAVSALLGETKSGLCTLDQRPCSKPQAFRPCD